MARSSAQNRDIPTDDTSDGNARRLGWRTMLLVIAAALALNILVGQFVQRVLQLPVYLDSIGTIVVGALFGPVVGALTGMVSNLLWGLLFQLPEIVPFAITAAWIGWAAGYAGQLNVFRQKISIGNFFLVAATGLFVGAIGALISAPIVAHLFGNVTGSGTDRLANYFGTLGATVLQQASLQTFISDPVDKVVSFVIAWLIWRPVSRRIGARDLLRVAAFDRVSALGKTILLSVVTLIAAWIFYPAFGRTIFSIFFIAVIVSAYMGGMWSGILATAIGAIAAIVMLMSPMGGGVQVQDWLQLAIFLFVSFFIIFITDRLTTQSRFLEEQKNLLEESNTGLRSANARIGAIMDSVNETLMLISPQRVMSNINARFATMFDTPIESVQDKSIADAGELLGQVFEKPELFTSMVEKNATITDGDFNETLGQKWPVPRELALYSTPVRTGDEFLGRLYLFRDITRERELARMQKEFVSMVSHELRTPLTSIRGFTEMVLDGDAGEINEEQEEYLGIVISNAERLIALINDILDVSRMESGRVEIKPAAIEVSALINPVVLSMRPLLQGKEQTISANIAPGLPPVQADVDKITQVLTNFVSNAHKYNNPGGWIRVDATRESDMARISVVDNGFGISEEDQKKLFQRFFRVENSLTRNIGGTGLGLNITKTIVEMHGGQVQVVSAPGEGSTFSFTLPLAVGASVRQYVGAPEYVRREDVRREDVRREDGFEAQSAPVGSQDSTAITTHDLRLTPHDSRLTSHVSGKRILIVEDDPDIARLLADQLHAEGYSTTIAATGEAALEEVARELPDLITLDIQLPGMDGIEVAQRLAMDPATTDLPVLVVSVTDKDPRLKQFGMRTLSKPLDRDALLANVSELLAEDEKRPVLVIDDDPDVRELLRANLTRAGFEVALAENGREGIELAQAHKPGLILLDLMMPGVDGFSVLQALKQNNATAGVPVVAMTGHDDVRLRARARLLSLGAADLVAKPLDMKSLLAEVQILIQTEE